MLFPAEQAFVGRDEKRAPLKTPAWEANATAIRVWCKWYKWIHPTIGWRRDEHVTHKHAHGSWILRSVSRVHSKKMHSLFCITS